MRHRARQQARTRGRRSPRSRLARAYGIAAAVRVLALVFRALPWSAAQGAGSVLGRLGWRFARRDRRRALEHLALAFPEASAAERERTGRAAYLHLGTNLGEVLWLLTRGCDAIAPHVKMAGLEIVEALRAAGRPILFVTGHCGNWELLAAAFSCRVGALTVVARAPDEAPLQRLVAAFRGRFGTRTVERGEAGAAKELLRTLRSGGSLAMLIDQDTRVEGVWVPFFGRPAYTPVGAARLALRRGLAVVPVFIERLPDGSHRAHFEPPLELPQDEVEATALMTRAIETQVRRVPEQWVWMHRRWRRQPEAAPAGPPGEAAPRARRPILPAVALAFVAALGACGPRPEVEPPAGWSRFDLVTETPGLDEDLHGATPPFEQRIGYLGSEEVRDMARVPESQLAAFPFRRAPQIRVVEQAAGTRLAWPVELGEDPYASFVPVGWRERPCRCLYRFGLRDARGEIHELYRSEAQEVTALAPGTVEIDLADFAGSRVEILTQVDGIAPPGEPPPAPPPGEAAPALVWGSPAVYHRRPVAGWRPGAKERPNVLLLGIDTLRADHVGAFRGAGSFAPSLTPAIDRLAAESDVWLAAFSTFNTTNPSFASILTGLYGKNHGIYDLQTPLPPEHRTLAELFSEAGYETLAVLSASHLGDHNSGLGQGFGEMRLSQHTFAGELPVDTAMDWIEARSERTPGEAAPPPFFAWLHLFDPHTPHTPPGPYGVGFRPAAPTGLHPVGSWLPFRRPGDRRFEQPVLGGQRDLYAGEVAYLDRQVDRLLGFLESRRLLEDTVVALVADHGENLGEHGIDYRHAGLWDTTTHVPLLVRWGRSADGGASGRRLEGLVQTIDLFPTLLAAAGIEAPPQDGTDLRQLTHDGRPGRRAVFAEHASGSGAMVRTATHKYIRTAGERGVPAGVYLYNLAADPAEERNLAGKGLPVERELAGLLERWSADRRDAPEVERRSLSDEEAQKLKALGYLN